MSLQLKEESIASLSAYYADPESTLCWPYLFSLPFWIKSWWQCFGGGKETLIRSVYEEGRLIGIAPLYRRGNEAFLIGSPDVCDYLDFIVEPGKEGAFFKALPPLLAAEGIDRLILSAQRPDACVFRTLSGPGAAGLNLRFWREDQSYELDLPSSWKLYLAALNKKQRHEVRRKLRRLDKEAASYRYRVLASRADLEGFVPRFFDLFRENPEKAAFLTPDIEHFFKLVIAAAAALGLVRFGLLEIGGSIAAAVLYFDYRGRACLYNSGYRPRYADLSAGLLSKLFLIRESIDGGRAVFDFLKGEEVYKSRLGGRAVPIYGVEILTA